MYIKGYGGSVILVFSNLKLYSLLSHQLPLTAFSKIVMHFHILSILAFISFEYIEPITFSPSPLTLLFVTPSFLA